MHCELNADLVLRGLERQRNEHLEEGRRLRALARNNGSNRKAPAGRRHAVDGTRARRWPWSWFGLRRRRESSAGAA